MEETKNIGISCAKFAFIASKVMAIIGVLALVLGILQRNWQGLSEIVPALFVLFCPYIIFKTIKMNNSNESSSGLKKYGVVLIGVILVLGFLFYWYEYRPSVARSECAKFAHNIESMYTMCLRQKGIVK